MLSILKNRILVPAVLVCALNSLAHASTVTYTFKASDIANAFSTYSASWGGTGSLGGYSALTSGTTSDGRPAPYTGGCTNYQVNCAAPNGPNYNSSRGAGIIDFFMRPDDLTANTQVTYSVMAQTSTASTLFSTGASNLPTLPNYNGATTFVTTAGQQYTMASNAQRAWAEFGDLTGNSRYMIVTNSIGTSTLYDSNGSTSSSAYLPATAGGSDTTFSVTLQGANINPGSTKFTFFLWGETYLFNGTKWVQSGVKDTYLGAIALNVNGVAATPEPSSIIVLGSGLLLIGYKIRRRRATN